MHIQELILSKIPFSKPNSFMHMFKCVFIVSAKYQIASSKAVVGVDRAMKAPYMHIQKPY